MEKKADTNLHSNMDRFESYNGTQYLSENGYVYIPIWIDLKDDVKFNLLCQ